VKSTLAITVVAVLAGGCGSDEAPLSQSEFTRRADAICVKAEARRAAGEAAAAAPEMMADLHDLQPPKRMEDAFKAWIDALDDVVIAAVAVRDTSSPAEKRAAGERLSTTADRVYETQEELPLPQSCMS
jgi:hypothetical protein